MITYIAIYMVIGLVVGIGALLYQYYILNRSIRVIDIISDFSFCIIGWPLVVVFVITILAIEYLPSNLKKLLNKVVIKRKGH